MHGKREQTHDVRHQGLAMLESFFAAGKGKSKHLDKQTDQKTAGKIYVDTTLITYKQAWNDYCDSMKRAGYKTNGHTPRTLDEAATYMPSYIDELKSRPGSTPGSTMSAWSIRTYFAGCAKVLGLSAKDYDLPSRHVADIKRSRGDAIRDKHFSEDKNADLINFCCCTGLRKRKELQRIHGTDLIERSGGNYAIHVTGKGGRVRDLPIFGTPEEVARVVSRMRAAGNALVWPHVPSAADIHSYRAAYAARMYNAIARDPRKIPAKDRYCCRGAKRGTWYDRRALKQVSLALGHTRINVVAEHYLWGNDDDE